MKAAQFVKSIKESDDPIDEFGEEISERDEVIDEDIVDTAASEVVPPPTFGLVEMILKNRDRLHHLIRSSAGKAELVPRFLAISLVGFTFFGVAMSVVLSSTGAWPQLSSVKEVLDGSEASLITFPSLEQPATADSPNPWLNLAAFKLIAAYGLGIIAATGICLPSLYFYGLLAGIKMSMLDVTVHALKCKATSAVALIGILPIYAAISMGMVIFGAPPEMLRVTLLLGLLLPFFAGAWGIKSMYAGFSGLCDMLPLERRTRRACFLRRLVLSWSACYTAIMPVMIFTLWQAM
ncbi:MAG: hypothetical protein WD065_12590 [Planctomycetaceae bacterium]